MIHRWAGNYGRAGESIGEYVQRFSQPVNPNQIGKIHSYDKTAEDPSGLVRSQERDNRIRTLRARPVADIEQRHPALASYVQKFVRGGLSRGPYKLFSDFAASYVGHDPTEVLVKQVIRADGTKGNAFYAEPWIRLMKLQFGRVTVTKVMIAGGITLLAIGAGIAYYYWLITQTGTADLGRYHRLRGR